MGCRSYADDSDARGPAVVLWAVAVLVLGLSGCATDTGDYASGAALDSAVSFWLEPSSTQVQAGEMVTVIGRSRNTVGRETAINWETTGGELSTLQADRVARVRFDEPGTYAVTGVLYLDGDVFDSDSVVVEVEPPT